MARCTHCRKKTIVCIECMYCNTEFCTRCIYFKTHSCPNESEYIIAKQQQLADRLRCGYLTPSHNL